MRLRLVRYCCGMLESRLARRSRPYRRELRPIMPVVFYVDAALQLTAQRLPLLDQAGAGVNERRRFYLYLMATQDLDVVQTFREALRHQGLDDGDDIMT